MDCSSCRGKGQVRDRSCRMCDATGVIHYAIDPVQFAPYHTRVLNYFRGLHRHKQTHDLENTSELGLAVGPPPSAPAVKVQMPISAEADTRDEPSLASELSSSALDTKTRAHGGETGSPEWDEPWYVNVAAVIVLLLISGGFYAAWRAVMYLIFQVWLGMPYEGSECAWC